MLVGHLPIGACIEQQWTAMTSVQVLDLSKKEGMVACLTYVHYTSNNVSNGPLQEWDALLNDKGDLKSVHWATTKVTAQPLLVVREHTDAVASVKGKQFVHLGIMPDGDQHQRWM